MRLPKIGRPLPPCPKQGLRRRPGRPRKFPRLEGAPRPEGKGLRGEEEEEGPVGRKVFARGGDALRLPAWAAETTADFLGFCPVSLRWAGLPSGLKGG